MPAKALSLSRLVGYVRTLRVPASDGQYSEPARHPSLGGLPEWMGRQCRLRARSAPGHCQSDSASLIPPPTASPHCNLETLASPPTSFRCPWPTYLLVSRRKLVAARSRRWSGGGAGGYDGARLSRAPLGSPRPRCWRAGADGLDVDLVARRMPRRRRRSSVIRRSRRAGDLGPARAGCPKLQSDRSEASDDAHRTDRTIDGDQVRWAEGWRPVSWTNRWGLATSYGGGFSNGDWGSE
jgi:hypothetical protein